MVARFFIVHTSDLLVVCYLFVWLLCSKERQQNFKRIWPLACTQQPVLLSNIVRVKQLCLPIWPVSLRNMCCLSSRWALHSCYLGWPVVVNGWPCCDNLAFKFLIAVTNCPMCRLEISLTASRNLSAILRRQIDGTTVFSMEQI